ncbi:hypothetical protein R1flu_005166 [Riccia fluitans]|uniref:AAA+ ATPase domain-containing protein n=1 Tax=Riccia fluitans TaxID=41844 RepID=A0ABD1YVD8_9MARC
MPVAAVPGGLTIYAVFAMDALAAQDPSDCKVVELETDFGRQRENKMGMGAGDLMEVDQAGSDNAGMELDNAEGLKLSASLQYKGKAAISPPAKKTGPWVEKYRPTNLSDVAAHKDIVDTIDRLTSENRLPHLLLYGPPGTGKTSTILAVARKLYGAHFQNMILELNASDDRGIDVVRNQIQDFASMQSISFGAKLNVKLIILDEADAMTKDAQFSLRRIIEKYTKSTRFCLICNYVSKIIPALQSRCTRFRFAPLEPVHVTERLRYVIREEGLTVTEGGVNAVVRLAGGDMRKALNVLQSTQMASPHVTEEAVYQCTGNPMPKDVQAICQWLLNESFTTAYEHIQDMKTNKGLALADIVKELLIFVFEISMPPEVRAQLVEALADVEYRLAFGTSEKLQLGALVSAFTHARVALVAAAQCPVTRALVPHAFAICSFLFSVLLVWIVFKLRKVPFLWLIQVELKLDNPGFAGKLAVVNG